MIGKFLAQTVEFRSPNNADDLTRGVHISHVFADWVFIGEMASLKRFVNDSDQRRAFDVTIIEKAPGAQWNSHGAKVISTHLMMRGAGSLLSRDRRMLLDREIRRRAEAVDKACALHTGYRADAFEQAPVKFNDLVKPIVRWINLRGQRARRRKTGIDAIQSPEAFQHQPRADQQNHRQRDFRYDQQRA